MVKHVNSSATRFAASGSEYWRTARIPATAEPLTLAAWVRLTVSGTQYGIVFCGDSGATGDWFSLSTNTAGNAEAWHRKNFLPSGTGAATGTTVLSAAKWYHLAAVFESSVSRSVYVDGVSEGTNTTSTVTDWTNDRYAIGYFGDSTPSSYLNGDLAHVCCWSTALSGMEVAALWNNGLGRDPRTIRKEELKAYHPMSASTFLRDIVGECHIDAFVGSQLCDPSPQPLVIESPLWYSRLNTGAAPAAGNSNLLLLGVG